MKTLQLGRKIIDCAPGKSGSLVWIEERAVMRKKTGMYLHETPTQASIINLPISQGAD